MMSEKGEQYPYQSPLDSPLVVGRPLRLPSVVPFGTLNGPGNWEGILSRIACGILRKGYVRRRDKVQLEKASFVDVTEMRMYELEIVLRHTVCR